MSKVVFKSGYSIAIAPESSIGSIIVMTDRADVAEIVDKVKAEDLSEVMITNDDGIVVGYYTDCTFPSYTVDYQEGYSVKLYLAIREKTADEKMADRIAALEAGQEILDGAVGDIAEVVSELVEG